MCSSPKGQTSIKRTRVTTLIDEMEYSEYSAMIRSSNASFERREQQKARLKERQLASNSIESLANRPKTASKSKSILSEFCSAISSALNGRKLGV